MILSIIFSLLFIILIMINLFCIVLLINNNKKEQNLDFNKSMLEFKLFSLNIICKTILDRILHSEKDSNGSRIALRQISDISDPFYSGIIVLVIGSLSDEMKRRFYTFYKKTKDESIMINEVSSILESYSFILIKRLKSIEEKVKENNKIAVKLDKRPIESYDYIFGILIESIIDDLKNLNNLT